MYQRYVGIQGIEMRPKYQPLWEPIVENGMCIKKVYTNQITLYRSIKPNNKWTPSGKDSSSHSSLGPRRKFHFLLQIEQYPGHCLVVFNFWNKRGVEQWVFCHKEGSSPGQRKYYWYSKISFSYKFPWSHEIIADILGRKWKVEDQKWNELPRIVKMEGRKKEGNVGIIQVKRKRAQNSFRICGFSLSRKQIAASWGGEITGDSLPSLEALFFKK